MENKDYLPRIIDKRLEDYLETFGAVNLVGAKWTGKSWTAAVHAASAIYIADPEGGFNNRKLAQMDPSAVLPGERPRLIDEWKEVPPIWDAVRFEVDKSPEKGKYILTGSATPCTKGIMHSGAGRFGTLRMRPMSLYKSGRSSGVVSLRDICSGKMETRTITQPGLDEIIDAVIRGGWPANQKCPLERAALMPQSYISTVLESDINEIDEKSRDITKVRRS